MAFLPYSDYNKKSVGRGELGNAMVELPSESDENKRMTLCQLEIDNCIHISVFTVELQCEF